MKNALSDHQQRSKALAQQAKRAGQLTDDDLDGFLNINRGFEKRVELLISLIGNLPLVASETVDEGGERRRISGMAGDDNLRRYLRSLGGRRKLDKSDEIGYARRIEFARRRFEKVVYSARIREDHLREVLGTEYSRTYSQDLDLPAKATSRSKLSLAESRRRIIRDRASELNRLRREFVERNLALVVDLALAYRTYGIPLMDLIQEGNGALIRAVEKFDWRKDVRFQTYATFWIRQAVERSIAFNKGIVRVPNYLQQKMRRLRREGVLPRRDRDVSIAEVSEAFAVKPEVAGHLLETERSHFSLDVTIDEDGETFASLLPDENEDGGWFRMEFPLLRRRLVEVLGSLSGLEREILELRFGLNGKAPLTLEEVGRRMSVSRERIRQLQVRAIRKLQRPGLMQRLAGFV